ncbi:sulfite exporter TauE/SafE family protein [Sulfurimonas sp. MAG313]|nr:sulfite exporter TauE/SafE family protein [Sulfurimonas sp. MAG313]MDF1880007.1 sulfite exporter TauE/SafE family protein [Sulfurimonas sp. MAG313]
MIELVFLGMAVGVLSGFFGIGGGTILVPILLFMGYDIKTAIGISVVQMVFSSLYGSFLNFKKGSLEFDTVLSIGIGGFIGALFSGWVVSIVPAQTLEYIFLGFVMIALARMAYTPATYTQSRSIHPAFLFLIGCALGVFAISIGVGGSILLVPILVGFLHFEIKKAISAGLFFVVFSSISGLISFSLVGHIQYLDGIIIGMASLVGVYLGVYLNHKTSSILQKRLLLSFYVSVLSYLLYRTFS